MRRLAAFSDDGDHVAFLVAANPTGGRLLGDLYVQDLRSGRRTLVDRADGLDGAEANGYARQFGVSMSADGRYVAFTSRATNLDPDDRDRSGDVYVRDLDAGTTTLVSRADGRHGQKGNRSSGRGGSISADGRYVAFTSAAGNLDPVDSPFDNDADDTFVRDLRTHRTTLAGRSQSGARGNKGSLFPALSGSGRYMVFSTASHNFDEADQGLPVRLLREGPAGAIASARPCSALDDSHRALRAGRALGHWPGKRRRRGPGRGGVADAPAARRALPALECPLGQNAAPGWPLPAAVRPGGSLHEALVASLRRRRIARAPTKSSRGPSTRRGSASGSSASNAATAACFGSGS